MSRAQHGKSYRCMGPAEDDYQVCTLNRLLENNLDGTVVCPYSTTTRIIS